MESIIGKLYEADDNSYCINTATRKKAFIVQRSPYDYYGYKPHPIEEDGATFTIVSEPYINMVDFPEKKEHTFINVQSSNTNSIYRVLFNKNFIK